MADSSDAFQEPPLFEVAICVQKWKTDESQSKLQQESDDETEDAVECLIRKLKETGLIVELVEGLASGLFLKIAAPVKVLGQAAEALMIKKPTTIGLEVQFIWDKRDVFVKQPEDNSLFSWTEHHQCLQYLLYTIVNNSDERKFLRIPDESKVVILEPGEALLSRLKTEGVINDIFLLHDEKRRKQLLDDWALNWAGFTSQPIDSIYYYFGPKIAIYFAFLGLYTKWLVFPSVAGIILYFHHFGSWELAVAPAFSMLAVSWAVLFLQFWKRKNAALLARWGQSSTFDQDTVAAVTKTVREVLSKTEMQKEGITNTNISLHQKHALQKEEWVEHIRNFRDNFAIIAGILCLQMPFELLYAHLSYIIKSNFLNFMLTGVYLLMIQFLTKIGGKIAVRLTKTHHYESREAKADSMIYKVFGVYFMQSYIGLFYHALFQRDFTMLRQFLVQRLVISQVINNFIENLVPYVTYRYAKHKAFKEAQEEKGLSSEKPKQHTSRIEKEYLKSSYTASIGDDLEDGLFDDFLELALQFGMVTMFACAFPLVFPFALINNLMEIRSDALKLLTMFRRPAPCPATSIGAWLNIFQYIGVLAICTNCALLVCLYDKQGKWTIEPGLAAILVMEHVLLLLKSGFSSFVPEKPVWVSTKQIRCRHVQDYCSRQILANLDLHKESLDLVHAS